MSANQTKSTSIESFMNHANHGEIQNSSQFYYITLKYNYSVVDSKLLIIRWKR